jgi:hypothetical protein
MKWVICVLVIFSIISCGGSKELTVEEQEVYNSLKEFIAEKDFTIVSDYARPQASSGLNSLQNSNILGNGNSVAGISLQGNPNFLKITTDTISAHLPFFGERRIGSGFGSNGAIDFNAQPNNYKVSNNDKKRAVEISFGIKGNSELYTINLTIFLNKRTTLLVTSSQRTNIEYTGSAKQSVSDR